MKTKRSRGWGMGRVFRQKGTLRWSIEYSVTGSDGKSKRKVESTGLLKRSEALATLKLRTNEISSGSFIDPSVRRNTRLSDLENLVTTDYAVNRLRSRDSVLSSFKRLKAHFGADRPIASITTADVEGFKAAQQQADVPGGKGRKVADATINRCLSGLRRGFRLARESRLVNEAPIIKMIREDNARSGFLEFRDFERLLVALPMDLRDPVHFLYRSGWRRGEMASLEWRDVNIPAGTVTLQAANSKNKHPRALVLRGELLAIIQRASANRNPAQTHVFLRSDGAPIADFRKAWANARKTVGLDWLLVHDLRRSCSRNSIKAGVPQSIAMRQTGHRTIATFLRYAIVSDADLGDAQDKLAAYLEAQPEAPQKVVPLVRAAS
jgi:integrase